MRALIASMVMASLASMAVAQSLDPARVEAFRSILKENDCVLTEAAAGNVLPQFDFTREETRAIVGALVAAGDVRLDGSTLSLVDGSCGTDDPIADLLGQQDVQQFIAIMAENQCTMAEADAEAIFAERGMTKAQVGAVAEPMLLAGMATFDAGVLNVNSAYCTPAVAAEEASAGQSQAPTLDRSGMFGMRRVRALVDVMAQNNCTLNMDVADSYLADAGIEHSFATNIAEKMLSDGYARMADAQNLVLSAPYCVSSGAAENVAQVAAAPLAKGSPEAIFISVAAQNGCDLDVNAAKAQLAHAGLRPDQAFRVVDDLLANANASLSNGGALVSLDSDICGNNTQPAEPVQPAMVQASPVASPPVVSSGAAPDSNTNPRIGVLAMLAENGCEVTQANAAQMISAAGLDYNTSMQVLTQMMGSGEATTPDGGQTLRVAAPLCVSKTAAPTTPRDIFINLIKQNNCSVTAAEFGTLLPVKGLDAPTAFAMISELEAEGAITLPATRDVVTLSAEMCR